MRSSGTFFGIVRHLFLDNQAAFLGSTTFFSFSLNTFYLKNTFVSQNNNIILLYTILHRPFKRCVWRICYQWKYPVFIISLKGLEDKLNNIKDVIKPGQVFEKLQLFDK